MEAVLDQPRLNAALDALATADPDVAAALARLGYPTARLRPPGLATLLRTITAQQISTKAAAAIYAKLEAALGGPPTPEGLLALDDAAFRAVGFSGQKVGYARGLARAVQDGTLDLDALQGLDDAAALSMVVALRGFGQWSAECYLLFAHGRIDLFPADDLALQVGFQRLRNLPERPKPKPLREGVAGWAPYRGAGALLLWHVYGSTTLAAVGEA